ncbi:hypothetical protein BXZ70DRAFT_901466, partial [Cristinia sonorae]
IGAGEDLYSGLSSFTFGAVQQPATHPADPADNISPLTKLADSADHTPRPSISGPGGTKPSSKSRNGKQRAAADADMGDDEYEDEDDNERQKSRAKMRALDDGSRRPSLPVNVYIPDGTQASSPTSAPSDPERQMSPGSNSEQDTSEPDAEEAAELDTDVEFDLHQHSGAEEHILSDSASQHTFGGGFDHYGFRDGKLLSSDQMSLIDDDENDSDGRAISMSPVTFTQPRDDELDSETEFPIRRQTFLYNIPTAAASMEDSIPTARNREDSMATVTIRRASRSMEDDLAGTASSGPSSSTSQFMELGHQGALAIEPESEAVRNDVYEGFRLDYILENDARRDSMSQASFMEINKSTTFSVSNQDISPFNFFPGVGGRRPSTITVGTTAGEDAFTRHVRKHDDAYMRRRRDWSFLRESNDGRGPKLLTVPPQNSEPQQTPTTMRPGTQEIWRNAFIGRFKVDRMAMYSDQPDKGPQQRVNVRHVVDPYSRGNVHGGPSSVIHKHSRAVAFSIFRTHALFAPSSRRKTTHMNTSISILLATKKVQEQYTSTRTTAKLNSHGLLEDRPLERVDGTLFSTTSTAAAGTSVRASSRASSAPGRKDKSKSRHKTRTTEGTRGNSAGVGSSSQTASGWSVQSSSASSTMSPQSSSPASTPSSPIMKQTLGHAPTSSISSKGTADTLRAPERATSMDSTANHSAMYSLSSGGSVTIRDQSSSHSLTAVPDDTMDVDDEQSPPRTSHAEAFATVDSNYIDYMRGRQDQRPHHHQDSDSSHSLFGGLRKFFPTGNTKTRGGPRSAGPSSASMGGEFDPPWMTMAPRSKVEERERVIQNLNESFKDVGLLPSFKQRNSEKSKRGKTNSATNIFANVPADCLYMLLPLWPGESESTPSEHKEDPRGYIIPVEERQYLLVYYVPFEVQPNKKKRDKKRTREELNHKASSSHLASSSGPNISLSSFRICARLVSYSDMRETGVRLPDYGLSITGSMTEATQHLPPPSIRDMSLDDIVIGVCTSRQQGMEIVPEGLVKLGLSLNPTSEEPVEGLKEEEEAPEPEVRLTPIGRAAVEMAWLGSMALTCFGTS